MAHLVRTWTDEELVIGFVPKGADLADIDQKTFVGMNGDGGGSYSPAAAIEIDGAGMGCGSAWTLSGGALVQTDIGKPITFDADAGLAGFGYTLGHSGSGGDILTPLGEPSPALQGSVTPGGTTESETRSSGADFVHDLEVYNGGRITSVTFAFRVGDTHAAVPQHLPSFRVVAMAQDGTVLPLRAADASTDADGFQVVPTPASGSAWYDGGATQTFQYFCNQNNVADVSHYVYLAEIIDESGENAWSGLAAAGNFFTSATLFYDSVAVIDEQH